MREMPSFTAGERRLSARQAEGEVLRLSRANRRERR